MYLFLSFLLLMCYVAGVMALMSAYYSEEKWELAMGVALLLAPTFIITLIQM